MKGSPTKSESFNLPIGVLIAKVVRRLREFAAARAAVAVPSAH